MKTSQCDTSFGNLLKNACIVVAGILFSVSVWAQATQLLVINAHQFYPASGYPSAVSGQRIPAGFTTLIFTADSGQPVYGQLTVRCRKGGEHRNVGLSYTGRGSVVQNPCGANNLDNFDLYLSSPNINSAYGYNDRIRVYGAGNLNSGPGPAPLGQFIGSLNFSQFYPAQGYMAVGGVNIPGGYNRYRFNSTDGQNVQGQLTIRCGNKEFRGLTIYPTGNGSMFVNPCNKNRPLNIDIYLSQPYVGPGTYGQILIYAHQ